MKPLFFVVTDERVDPFFIILFVNHMGKIVCFTKQPYKTACKQEHGNAQVHASAVKKKVNNFGLTISDFILL